MNVTTIDAVTGFIGKKFKDVTSAFLSYQTMKTYEGKFNAENENFDEGMGPSIPEKYLNTAECLIEFLYRINNGIGGKKKDTRSVDDWPSWLDTNSKVTEQEVKIVNGKERKVNKNIKKKVIGANGKEKEVAVTETVRKLKVPLFNYNSTTVDLALRFVALLISGFSQFVSITVTKRNQQKGEVENTGPITIGDYLAYMESNAEQDIIKEAKFMFAITENIGIVDEDRLTEEIYTQVYDLFTSVCENKKMSISTPSSPNRGIISFEAREEICKRCVVLLKYFSDVTVAGSLIKVKQPDPTSILSAIRISECTLNLTLGNITVPKSMIQGIVSYLSTKKAKTTKGTTTRKTSTADGDEFVNAGETHEQEEYFEGDEQDDANYGDDDATDLDW